MYVERLQQKSRNKIVGLYPTVKVTIFLIYAVGTLLLALIPMGRWKLPLLLFPNLAVMVLLFGVSGKIKEFVSTIKHLAVMLIIIVSVQVFFIKGENPELVWQFAFVKIHAYGLRSGIRFLCCILGIAGMFSWLFATTSRRDLCVAFQKMGMGYKKAYVFLSSFAMIDTMRKNMTVIMDSQRARGVETQGNIFVRAKALIPSLVPLVVSAFMSSEERALALESKGFEYECEKTTLIDVLPNQCEKYAWAGIGLYVRLVIGGVVLWIL